MTYFSFAAFSKTSELYTWLNSLPPDSELLECGQLHRGLVTAFLRTSSPVSRPIISADFFTYQDTGERFLKAYHKQNSIPVTHGVLVVECEKLSEMCAMVLTDAEFKDFQLLEVSRNALPGGSASAIFVNVDHFKYPEKFSGAYLEKLNPQMKSLFL
jgi:hypothetical protein